MYTPGAGGRHRMPSPKTQSENTNNLSKPPPNQSEVTHQPRSSRGGEDVVRILREATHLSAGRHRLLPELGEIRIKTRQKRNPPEVQVLKDLSQSLMAEAYMYPCSQVVVEIGLVSTRSNAITNGFACGWLTHENGGAVRARLSVRERRNKSDPNHNGPGLRRWFKTPAPKWSQNQCKGPFKTNDFKLK